LNSSDETLLDQNTEGVVHGLSRDGTDFSLGDLGDAVGRDVGVSRHCPQHGQALGRNLDTVLAKEVSRAKGHSDRLHQNLE
jgi:hypothetical protein